jgi:hypothetical protein
MKAILVTLLALMFVGTAAAGTSGGYQSVSQAEANVAHRIAGASDVYCIGNDDFGSVVQGRRRAYAVLKCYCLRRNGDAFSVTYAAGRGSSWTLSRYRVIG